MNRLTVAVGAAATLLLTACGASGTDRLAPPPSAEPFRFEFGNATPTIKPASTDCDLGRNLRPTTPPDPKKAGATGIPTLDRIRQQKKLVVGVDQNTRFFAELNTGDNTINGFDIDIAREVARAVFGDPNAIQLQVISPTQRIDVIDGDQKPGEPQVDLVIDTVSVDCERLQRVDFSAPYLADSQRILLPKGSSAQSLADLKGQRVCAVTNTTTIREIQAAGAVPYGVADRTDCLVAIQQGLVAAASTNALLLQGLADQDPSLEVRGPAGSEQLSAIAVPKGDPEFVRFLNGVIERLKTNGTWAELHKKWLDAPLGQKGVPPAVKYEG